MHLQHKRLTALLAASFFAGSLASPIPSLAITTANPLLGTDVVATVTAHKGIVFKRDHIDFAKQVYGEPAPVKDQDKLQEGMQIGTGNDSWAEVQWPSVRTRAWANTVFEVAPNKRLVYLTGGEMLFRLDKHRPDKNQPYYIWTKVLQARIRGTTVLVQARSNTTRFTVMEGVVDIWNRLDHSHVTLNPGAVYEVKGFDMSKQVPLPDIHSSKSSAAPEATIDKDKSVAPYHAQAVSGGTSEDRSVADVTYDSHEFMPLFQDKYEQTNVYASNAQALENHPLVTGLTGTIDSIDLIHQAQKDLPSFNPLVPIRLSDESRLEKTVFKSLQVKGVPTNADWYVGKSFAPKLAQLAFVDLQPKGVVFNPSQAQQSAAPPNAAALGGKVVAVHPFIPGGIPIQGVITDKKVNLDEEVPAPVQEYAGADPQPPHIAPGDPAQKAAGLSPSPIQFDGSPFTGPAFNGAGSVAATQAGAAAAVSNITSSGSTAVKAVVGTVLTPVSPGISATVVTPFTQPSAGVFTPAGAGVGGLGNALGGGAGQLNNTLNNTLNGLGGIKLH